MSKLNKKTLEALQQFKEQILAIIPKGTATHKKQIQALEQVNRLIQYNLEGSLYQLNQLLPANKQVSINDDVAILLKEVEDKDFDKINQFFQRANKIIRKKILEHQKYSEILKAIQKESPYTSKNQRAKAYSMLLDYYDPNKKQNIQKGVFNWGGFIHLASIKNGEVSVLRLDAFEIKRIKYYLKRIQSK